MRALILFTQLLNTNQNQMGWNLFKYARRSFVVTSLFLILSVQAREKPSFVGLRAGLSFPFGKYAATTLGDGSFTQVGMNVSVDGAWFFKQKFGIGGSVGLHLNPVDAAALATARLNKDPFLNSLVIRSEPWQIITAMVGPWFQLPVSPRFSFSAKLLGGLMYGKTPYQLYKPEYYLLPDNWAEITSAKDYKFSWQTGVGLVYNLSSCISLVFDADLFYDQLSFGFYSSTGYFTRNKTIAIVNTTLGFRINL